jgi:TM2 domain-containing membrane protein YozV
MADGLQKQQPQVVVNQVVNQPGFPITPVKKGRYNRNHAMIFAFLLGGVGGHKFYLGQFGWGILYLAFCWTYVPILVSLSELLWYATMTDEQFEARFGQ